ncbi:beta-carotene hydroxylase [Pseudomonas syringae]|nr:sterol desaturase family protein [Pseudomonas syringae]MBI6669648.1 sterol desaturase family protein [Pseudomonas syringae]MBI6679659.1 sterol desaturase family protein [Pseudomonas syringae]MBI6839639.1 sterol desaturase family protein [Pseudomonas syringae]NAP22210.1 beta-carotene hydroxylase [Pseudomonas syringae]NAQ17819.1 beta-carotene hydroxylase [Pseudomonas syringae]
MMLNALVFLTTFLGMEVFAFVAHKYVMHGWGWSWHRSHHEPESGWFEKNDLYAVVFALFAIMLIALGTQGMHPLEWVGAGMTAYGLVYFIVHDWMVHKRWPLRYVPRNGYLKRLYQGHLMHHAVSGKERCVSFGFLYTPATSKLREQLRELHGGPLNKRDEDVATDLHRARATDDLGK